MRESFDVTSEGQDGKVPGEVIDIRVNNEPHESDTFLPGCGWPGHHDQRNIECYPVLINSSAP